MTGEIQARLPVYDLYGLVHKGLRHALGAQLTCMAGLSLDDEQGLQMMLDDLEGLLYLVTIHSSHEDGFLHPAIERRHSGGSAFLTAGHELLEREISALRGLATQLSAAETSERPAAHRELYLRFSAFVGHNLVHMAEEELRGQPLFDVLYTPAELEAIHQTLLRAIGPEEKLAFLRAMLAGANRDERQRLLDMASAQLPQHVWSTLLAGLKPTYSPPSRRRS